MKHSPRQTSVLAPPPASPPTLRRVIDQPPAVPAPEFGIGQPQALRRAVAGVCRGMRRLAAAVARAEQRVTEQFRVPPGGG